MSYLLLCAWGVCIFCSFLGYGTATLRSLRIRDAPWPLAAIVGVAVSLAVGGLFNLASWVTRPVIITFVIVGVLLVLSTALTKSERLTRLVQSPHLELSQTQGGLFLAVLLVALLCSIVLGNIRADTSTFSPIDDLPSYINFPVEMLQCGNLPSDPFNLRRVISSLGGPYFLQTFMLVFGDIRTVPFADAAVGIVLYAAMLFTIWRSFGLSLKQSFIAALMVWAVPVIRSNLTMTVLPAAIFAALFLIQVHPCLQEHMRWRRSVLLGLTVAALCCLKSCYLPAAVLIGILYYVAALSAGHPKKVLTQLGIFAMVVLCCLLPWMLQMKETEGTYLFPILGRGYDASAYGVLPFPGGSRSLIFSTARGVWLSIAVLAVPPVLAAAGPYFAHKQGVEKDWAPICNLLLGAGFGAAAVASSTGGESIGRYTSSFEIPAFLILAGDLFRWRKKLQIVPAWFRGFAVFVSVYVVCLGVLFGIRDKQYQRYAEDVVSHWRTSPGIWPETHLPKRFDVRIEREKLVALQSAVPVHTRILAHLHLSFGLDFNRNQIFLADWIGLAGLQPGMPVGKGPQRLREYFLQHAIRYIAFSRVPVHQLDPIPGVSLNAVLANPTSYGRNSWSTLQVKVIEDERSNLSLLGTRYKRLYDDGQIYVFKLDEANKRDSGLFLTRRTH